MQFYAQINWLIFSSTSELNTNCKATWVKKMGAAVITFSAGCGIGAAGFMFASVLAFGLPVILAIVVLFASGAGAEP